MREELDRALRDLNTTYTASSNNTWDYADLAYWHVLSLLSPAKEYHDEKETAGNRAILRRRASAAAKGAGKSGL
jgi:hypothetical protein